MYFIHFLLVLSSSVSSKQCKVLILSGGGSYGAYEAGVLKGLVDNSISSDITYDVVTGISAGSLNTLGLSQFPPGQESAAADFLRDMWLNLDGRDDAMRSWMFGVFQGLIFKSSIFDNSPLKRYLKKIVTQKPVRTSIIGTTSLNTGNYVTFDNNRTIEEFIDASIASSAIPGIFPPSYMNNDVYVDGGVVFHMDIFNGIRKCLETGSKSEEIIVDMISCSAKRIKNDRIHLTPYDVLQRAEEIRDYYDDMKHLAWAIKAYSQITYRYYIMPSQDFPGVIPLQFEKEDIEFCYELGYLDASYVVRNKIMAKDVFPKILDSDGTIYVN